jgi:hypothetical protein
LRYQRSLHGIKSYGHSLPSKLGSPTTNKLVAKRKKALTFDPREGFSKNQVLFSSFGQGKTMY